jgi:hypothetical protein
MERRKHEGKYWKVIRKEWKILLVINVQIRDGCASERKHVKLNGKSN